VHSKIFVEKETIEVNF